MTYHYVIDVPAQVRAFLSRCLDDLGLCETAPNLVPGLTDGNPRPWCAALATRWLHDCGVVVRGSDSARDLLKQLGEAGYSIPHDGPLLPGDVVGWERYEAGQVVGAHVSVVLAAGPGWLDVIAGNSGVRSDRVAISIVSPGKAQWAARPFPVRDAA